MKNTFYVFVLLALCGGIASADSALHQAHRANAFGIMNNEQDDPAALRAGSGLDFDKKNPVAVQDDNSKGNIKGYTYYDANGTVKKVDFDPAVPPPSEAMDATYENTKDTTSSPKKTAKKQSQRDQKVYPSGYAGPRNKHLVDHKSGPQPMPPNPSASRANTPQKTYKYIKPSEENLPVAQKNRLEKSRKQAAEREARHKMWREKREAREKAEAEAKAKTQAEQEEPAYTEIPGSKMVMTPELRRLLIARGIDIKTFEENARKSAPADPPAKQPVKTVKKFTVPQNQVQADKKAKQAEDKAEEERKMREWEAKERQRVAELKQKYTQEDPCNDFVRTSVQDACRRCCILRPTMPTDDYEMTGGYLSGNDCICTYKKLEYNPCIDRIRYASDEGCTECCKFRPPIDPNEFEITYGKLVENGKYCRCFWQKKETESERQARLQREEQERIRQEEQRQKELEEERRRQQQEEEENEEEEYNGYNNGYNSSNNFDLEGWVNKNLPW